LGFPPEPRDLVYKWTGIWNQYQFDPDDLVFYPEEPTFAVGEGMIVKLDPGSTVTAWIRNFTVQ